MHLKISSVKMSARVGELNNCISSADRVQLNEICYYSVLKWVAVTWLNRWVLIYYLQTSSTSRTKSQNLHVSWLVLPLSCPKPLKPGVKSQMKMYLERRRQAMLQLHLNDRQFYGLLRCVLYQRFDGSPNEGCQDTKKVNFKWYFYHTVTPVFHFKSIGFTHWDTMTRICVCKLCHHWPREWHRPLVP